MKKIFSDDAWEYFTLLLVYAAGGLILGLENLLFFHSLPIALVVFAGTPFLLLCITLLKDISEGYQR